MSDLSTLTSCSDLTEEHATTAAGSAEEIRALLRRVVEIARPGEGCPKILRAVARLVGQSWVEGDLHVELSGDDDSTTVDILCAYGLGIRERLLPAARFEVPLDEFKRALALAPHLALPLKLSDIGGKLVLAPEKLVEAETPPPSFEVDRASLAEGERPTAPPPANELQVVDEAQPEEFPLEPPPDAAPLAAKTSVALTDEAHPEEARGPSGANVAPTVRRMVAVDKEAIAAYKRRDPRREDD